MLRKFTTLCSPLACVAEKQLQLSQKSLLGMGRTKHDSQDSQHTICMWHMLHVVGNLHLSLCSSRQFRANCPSFGLKELCCTADC